MKLSLKLIMSNSEFEMVKEWAKKKGYLLYKIDGSSNNYAMIFPGKKTGKIVKWLIKNDVYYNHLEAAV